MHLTRTHQNNEIILRHNVNREMCGGVIVRHFGMKLNNLYDVITFRLKLYYILSSKKEIIEICDFVSRID